MAGSTTKKAVIRRFEKESLVGYVNSLSYLQPTGVELLSAEGQVATLSYGDIKSISFVREFEAPDGEARKVFLTRPKMEGLWVSFTFRDGEVVEGVLPNNLLLLEPYGFTMVPPDSYGNIQRVFVPRTALQSVAVLGVVGSPLQRRRAKPEAKQQIGLFEE